MEETCQPVSRDTCLAVSATRRSSLHGLVTVNMEASNVTVTFLAPERLRSCRGRSVKARRADEMCVLNPAEEDEAPARLLWCEVKHVRPCVSLSVTQWCWADPDWVAALCLYGCLLRPAKGPSDKSLTCCKWKCLLYSRPPLLIHVHRRFNISNYLYYDY